ncbi:oligosaccharide flippase family protein [Peribacillus frigoritolerans]|uniref:oligosaccharide flippase family protein n=1 Tax=Peribacillus frigoritolerans TaxID=450367 RepID=UPI00399EEDEC
MSSIKINFSYNIIYQLFLIILPLFTAPYVTRVLGASNLGIYSYTYSIANYFLLFAMLGILNYGNRNVAYNSDNKEHLSKTFWNIYALQLLTSIVIITLYIIYLNCFNIDNKTIAILQICYLFSCVFDINWFFFGMEKFKITVTRNIIIKLITVVLIFIFVTESDDLWIYTLILSIGTLFSQLIMWIFIRKYIDFYKPNFKEIVVHIKPIIILFIPVIAVSVYKIMDKIMIGNLSNIAQVGYFEYALLIVNVPLTICVALATVMLPRMSKLVASGNTKKGERYIELSMMFSVCISVGLSFGIASIATVFTPIFYGPDFIVTGYLIELLAPTVMFTAWANVIRTQYLIPNGMDSSYILSVLMGAIVNIIINLLLIPKIGAYGAVIGTFCAEATVCILQSVAVRKHLEIRKYFKDNIPFVIIGIIMFLFVKVIGLKLDGSILALFTQIFCGGIIYITLIVLYLRYAHKSIFDNIFNSIRRFF